MKGIHIDRKRHLADDPKTGHNRWHPDIAPLIEVDEGEEVALETRDALDGYLTSGSTIADFTSLPFGAIHPLTGPVLVKGARPGDVLEVEFVDIVPQRWAFSAIMLRMALRQARLRLSPSFTPSGVTGIPMVATKRSGAAYRGSMK